MAEQAHSEQSAPRSPEARVGRRGEQKRAADLKLRHPCESCGVTLVFRQRKVCQACRVERQHAQREARRRRIAAMWNAGDSAAAIASALGSTPGSIQVEVTYMRRDGWDLERRARVPRGRPVDV